MTAHVTNPLMLPDNLPRPVDDGAAAHLAGMPVPGFSLRATTGKWVDLSAIPGRSVVYAYPMTGVPGVDLPAGWNDIPGARGCTPQTLSFQAQREVFAALGVTVFGLSTQNHEHQKELVDRLDLTFAILSDADFKLTEALRLPTMTVEDMRLIKRLTLIMNAGTIEHVFYPVFPPDSATPDVVAWLRDNPAIGTAQEGVLIYTMASCRHCEAAKALLREEGIAFVEIDVDQEPNAAAEMVARSGRRSVPQIFINGRPIGGGDDLAALQESGELRALTRQAL